MATRYLLLNSSPRPITLANGDELPPKGFGPRLYAEEDLHILLSDPLKERVRVCAVLPCDRGAWTGVPDREPPIHLPAGMSPSTPQRRLLRQLTRRSLPWHATRKEAADQIDRVMAAQMRLTDPPAPELAAPANLPRVESPAAAGKTARTANIDQIIPGRLFLAKPGRESLDTRGFTLVLNLCENALATGDETAVLKWPVGQHADRMLLSGVIRLAATSLSGQGQRVLFFSDAEAGELVVGCVLREHLGASPEEALAILRRARPTALTNSMLLETLFSYKVS